MTGFHSGGGFGFGLVETCWSTLIWSEMDDVVEWWIGG